MSKRADIFNNIDPELLRKFKTFHLNNPNVYAKFREYAVRIKATGKKKYSAWTIIQVIRWEEDLKTTGDVFEINNDYIAIYARLLIYHNQEFDGFFELRSMKEKRRLISKEEKQRRGNDTK